MSKVINAFSNVTILNAPSFSDLCYDNVLPGAPYADAIQKHTADIAHVYLKNEPDLTGCRVNVLSVPRGGVPTALSLTSVFQSVAKSTSLCTSQIKHSKDLFPAGFFDDADAIAIADGIIGTGGTITQHLAQIPPQWTGKVFVFANATSELGLDTIAASAEDLQRPVEIVTGRVLRKDECQWFTFGDKKVYFVGCNQERGIDYKLPDFGDHIQHPSGPRP